MLRLAVAALVLVNLVLLYTLLHRGGDSSHRTADGSAAVPRPSRSAHPDRSGHASLPAPRAAATTSGWAATSASSAPSTSSTAPSTSSTAPTRSSAPTSSSAPTRSSAAPHPAPPSPRAHRATGQAIVLNRQQFVAQQFHPVRLDGTWRAVPPGEHAVRVEQQRGAGWSAFPLPAVTSASGRFTAYVDLGGPGTYRLRVVGSTGRPASSPFLVTVR